MRRISAEVRVFSFIKTANRVTETFRRRPLSIVRVAARPVSVQGGSVLLGPTADRLDRRFFTVFYRTAIVRVSRTFKRDQNAGFYGSTNISKRLSLSDANGRCDDSTVRKISPSGPLLETSKLFACPVLFVPNFSTNKHWPIKECEGRAGTAASPCIAVRASGKFFSTTVFPNTVLFRRNYIPHPPPRRCCTVFLAVSGIAAFPPPRSEPRVPEDRRRVKRRRADCDTVRLALARTTILSYLCRYLNDCSVFVTFARMFVLLFYTEIHERNERTAAIPARRSDGFRRWPDSNGNEIEAHHILGSTGDLLMWLGDILTNPMICSLFPAWLRQLSA